MPYRGYIEAVQRWIVRALEEVKIKEAIYQGALNRERLKYHR